jgi:hypothetical protein
VPASFVLAILIALQFTPSARTCAWSEISRNNAAQLVPEFFNYADTVVRARVLSMQSSDGVETAQVAVLHAFKGGASTRQPLQITGHPGWCGYRFTVGEERIYFVKQGVVSSAGAKSVSPWLLAALNGVARTAPPPPQAAPAPEPSEIRVHNASR